METVFSELGTFNKSIFSRIHLFFVDNYLVYYDSIDKYKSRTEPSTKHKLHYHYNNLILVFFLAKYTLLTLMNSECLNYYSGDVFSLYFADHEKIYGYIIFVLILVIMVKITIYFYETNSTINWSKLVSNDGDGRLLKYHQHTLLIMANLIYLIGKIGPLIGLVNLSMCYIMLNFLAYIHPDYDFSIIVLIFSTIQIIAVIRIVNYVIAGCIMFFSILIIFLKLKQDEIVRSIRLNVLWRNKFQFYNTLKEYHDFTIFFEQITKVINKLIGMVYLLSPVIFSQFIMILNGQSDNIFEIMLKNIVILTIPFMIIVLFLIIHIATSITTVNESIANYLYPVFKNISFNRPDHHVNLYLNYQSGMMADIMMKLKIDSFIARLNKEYLGFYCFNLFKLTKLVVFEYFYLFLTAYMFIHDHN